MFKVEEIKSGEKVEVVCHSIKIKMEGIMHAKTCNKKGRISIEV